MPPRKKSTPAPPLPKTEPAPPISIRSKALVFISHDSRDGGIAEAFANLLADVSGGTLKSFRSSDKKGASGIEFGAEWYNAIMTKLGDATDVVALLTQRSIDRPWILYEAGVAKGKLDTTVLGIAIGVPLEKVTSGPFGQFQNSGDDEDSLTKLVLQLLHRNPDASPREEAVRMQVRVFRDQLTQLLKTSTPSPPSATPTDEAAIAKLFEEVKVMVRDLPEKLASRSSPSRRSSRRLRHMHPGMLRELLYSGLGDDPEGQAAAWLLFVSIFRDDLPWFYEAGIEVYRALRSHNPTRLKSAKRQMQLLSRTIMHLPFPPEFLGADEDAFMIVRHLPDLIEEATAALRPARTTRSKTPETPEE